MEFLGDVNENVDIDSAGFASATIATTDNHVLMIEADDGSSLPFKANTSRDESFESSTAVIDEAKGTALKLIEKATTANDDEALATKDEEISVDGAVAYWKELGRDKVVEDFCPPSLDRVHSLFDADEALTEPTNGEEPTTALTSGGVQALTEPTNGEEPKTPLTSGGVHFDNIVRATGIDGICQDTVVKITIENKRDATPAPVEVPNTQTKARKEKPRTPEHKGFLETTFDAVGIDKICGVEEASTRKNMALAQDRFPKLGIDARVRGRSLRPEGVVDSNETAITAKTSVTPASREATVPKKPAAALVTTPNSGRSESDYAFPEMLRGTKDIFANTDLVREEAGLSTANTRHNISPDVFSNEFSSEDHPESIEHLLWDRLASLCEPLPLEQLSDGTENVIENDVVLGPAK